MVAVSILTLAAKILDSGLRPIPGSNPGLQDKEKKRGKSRLFSWLRVVMEVRTIITLHIQQT